MTALVTAPGRVARRRALLLSVTVAGLLALACAVAVSVGEYRIPLRDVAAAAFGTGDAGTTFVVQTLRLPRVLTGAVVGAAFGLSGALFQGLARNPLASPDVLGVTAGASTVAVAAIVTTAGGLAVVSSAAAIGAVLSAAAVYLLAYRAGLSPYRLVLVGIGIGAVLNSVTAYLLTRSEIWDAQQAMIWLVGSLNERGWEHLWPVVGALAVLTPVAVWAARPLRVMQLGDDTARALGVPLEVNRLILILAAVGLAAVGVAAAGPVPFVAFVAPAIARQLVRTSVTLIPAALLGALLVVVADLLARTVAAPTELPVGVITGVVGAPYLLWLLARANRLGAGG
ncbi:iron chelate uptake ABC transporter family permease subunit [Actinoplanes sp. L3-i22]|uniref:FecCD family ABC transporter permease n=1 Tax=Actinoplanes sp. L3-i22 TaxID=2836373 RepID=UPI001C77A81F|nr:iron chelate uptake ABC transporter family permease subunit [Actinoplanes sp. L3-i22]BCY11514.1 iron ABC transporter permease [Actinoplanes sp. L3-i22]